MKIKITFKNYFYLSPTLLWGFFGAAAKVLIKKTTEKSGCVYSCMMPEDLLLEAGLSKNDMAFLKSLKRMPMGF